jgi:GDP-fucose protein O-fucosyltransferase
MGTPHDGLRLARGQNICRYLFFANPHMERIYKRIVRDRLHYHDDIFCNAGKLVQLVHEDASRVTGQPVQRPEAGDPLTLGGNTNEDATYHAYHIRRGDFQYKQTRLTIEEIYETTKHLFNISRTNLLYIATDEKNKTMFDFLRGTFEVRFLEDYLSK